LSRLWVQLWIRCSVEFSWDEPKREWVPAERGIDFLRVAFSLFDGRPLVTAPTPRGEDRTDWRKANTMTGKKLEASIRADVDDVRGEPDWTQATMGVPAPKDHINIRVDHDVLAWFKANGRGYQTRMNNVLRAFVQSRRQREPTRSN
jgi:uncharacterized protein (DUF4415 family)